MLRARGRDTGTRRPPRVTDPRPVPCRTAVRSGSCLPFGPAIAVISASNIACITAIPAATLIANSPSRVAAAISVNTSPTSSGRSGNSTVSDKSATRTTGTVFTSGPLPSGVPWQVTRDLPLGRTQVGDRHLKFHEDWDNLAGTAAAPLLVPLLDNGNLLIEAPG